MRSRARYTYTLWAARLPPPGMPANKGRYLGMETDVPSCAVPGAGGAAVDDSMALCVLPAMLVGPAKEIDLIVRVDVVEP